VRDDRRYPARTSREKSRCYLSVFLDFIHPHFAS
jgi:hypothetical protein